MRSRALGWLGSWKAQVLLCAYVLVPHVLLEWLNSDLSSMLYITMMFVGLPVLCLAILIGVAQQVWRAETMRARLFSLLCAVLPIAAIAEWLQGNVDLAQAMSALLGRK